MPIAAWVKALWKRLSLSFNSSTWRSSASLRWKYECRVDRNMAITGTETSSTGSPNCWKLE